MTNQSSDEQALLPPILRPEVFVNQGAVEWFRGERAPRIFAPWILVLGSALSITGLILAGTLLTHRQMIWYTGMFVPGTQNCESINNGCSVFLQITSPSVRKKGELATSSFLDIKLSENASYKVQVIARPKNTELTKLLVSWPNDVEVPTGAIMLGVAREQSLIRWVISPHSKSMNDGEP